ncbi:radical SAM protein [Papillibacter cinnamivorans]|nr:radical SAM protein [Papillibacter cinnamivorans]
MGRLPVVARAGLHLWEEPCISGARGSGTVFFSGCSLGCVFCQNYKISSECFGREISVSRLREIYRELLGQGAHNINLVSPAHFADAVLESLDPPLPVPVVWNSGGYDRVDTLRRLEGKVQVYLPDMKYSDDALSLRYSGATDYFETAKAAITEMVRQTGPYEMKDGLLEKGVLIRHLILPGQMDNTRGVIDWISAAFPPKTVLVSLMGQYTPCGPAAASPPLDRRVTRAEYRAMEEYLLAAGITDGYLQEPDASGPACIPDFDLTGI